MKDLQVEGVKTSSKGTSEICHNPLKTWISNHGARSLDYFIKLESKDFKIPLMVNSETSKVQLEAWIDPENRFDEVDKLSMVNTLLQLENVGSYRFMAPVLEGGKALLHALWYDIKTKSVMIFSR